MFDIQNYSSFVPAILVFQLIPGAGTIAILNATARQGLAVGMAAVLGTLVGDFVMMFAAVAGLAAIMQAKPILFQALQWFGAAYLCWMGLQLLRATVSAATTSVHVTRSPWNYFRQAFAVSVTNPNVSPAFGPWFRRSGVSRDGITPWVAPRLFAAGAAPTTALRRLPDHAESVDMGDWGQTRHDQDWMLGCFVPALGGLPTKLRRCPAMI